MLVDFMDKMVGGLSKKWLIGRRVVLDLSSANERRVSVVELPVGTFSFDLKEMGSLTELVLVSEGGVQVLGTFNDPEAAEAVAKRLRLAILRPLKKIVMAFAGLIIVLFALDLMSMPRAARMSNVGAKSGSPAAASSGLSQDQLMAVMAARQQGGLTGAPGAAPGAMPSAPAQSIEPASDSAPEAQAAIKLLRGK